MSITKSQPNVELPTDGATWEFAIKEGLDANRVQRKLSDGKRDVKCVFRLVVLTPLILLLFLKLSAGVFAR